MASAFRSFVSFLLAALLTVSGSASALYFDGPLVIDSVEGVLDDIQVGERDNQTRIALLCTSNCALEKRSETEFLLRGAGVSFDLDLSARADNIDGLSATTHPDGAILTVRTDNQIEFANTKLCRIGERPAACIDLFFPQRVVQRSPAKQPTVAKAPAQPTQPELRDQPALRDRDVPEKIAAIANEDATTAIVTPSLREGSPARLRKFADKAPPVRLTTPNATLAKVQSAAPDVDISQDLQNGPASDLSLRAGSIDSLGTSSDQVDYSARVLAILDVTLTDEYCRLARTRLQDDPWALEAMVDVGLCYASRGDLTGAEDILSRLLDYQGDVYKAHVGRALIAELAGEKSVARRYYQSALNAQPPLQYANRITNAMNRL